MPGRTRSTATARGKRTQEEEQEEEQSGPEEAAEQPGAESSSSSSPKKPKSIASCPPAAEKRVVLAESSLWTSSAGCLCRLRHPASQSAATFLFNGDNTQIREMMTFHEEHRCWFLGSTIESHGQLYLATHVDPLLLILPYLRAAERRMPLEHLLIDRDYPELERLTQAAFTRHIGKIADGKGPSDLNVWEYSESKTLSYLARKTKRLCQALIDAKVNVEGGATSGTFVKSMNQEVDQVQYLRYAHGILSEYLEPDLAKKVADHLELPEEKAKVKKRDTPEEAGSGSDSGNAKKKPRRSDALEPEEDYSKSYKKPAAAKEAAQTAKQKALAKSASGSKNIMSFFKKK